MNRVRSCLIGLLLPETVEVSAPLIATFSGPSIERELPDGLIEATRDIDVAIPASTELGTHQGQLSLLWADGHTEALDLTWEVARASGCLPPAWCSDHREIPSPGRS